jgi:hypothetical protein
MADQKISQLSDGGTSQATDEYVIARSGANYRIDGASIAAAATSVGTLSSLTVSGNTTLASSSGSVGVNVSPTANAKVTVSTAAITGIDLYRSDTNANFGAIRFRDTTNAATNGQIGWNANQLRLEGTDEIVFATSSAEKMRIDASGNVGIGVTPSAWSAFTALQVGHGALASTTVGNHNVSLAANAFYDGSGWKYIGTNFATEYRQNGGSHQWFSAASGTAGNAITFTQAMTLDASGNLGVGTSSPGAYRLNVNKGAAGDIAQFTDGVANTFIVRTASSTLLIGEANNQPLAFVTNNAERARITSGGNFGVNCAATNAKLEVVASSGEVFRADAAGGAGRIVANQTETILGGNIALGVSTSFGGGSRVVAIREAETVPTTNPVGNGLLYVEGGALKYRGTSGTVTTIANA